ncbi:unnamed protein product [Brassica oleracea var. botrytis]|uniref:Uncharacterized protein n=3 Tax=Brassica TaxID=3705 RepID=A0A3P6CPQ4_BRAOL|nr:unnamed protein product [Brassica napus]CDY27683.1 BnaUnng00330D [Brassica napus]VDD12131.1 unnamed protein product [Brassica oleracea]
MSNSDEEETMAIAHLQSIRQRRRPPHSKRRASRDSAAKVKMNSTWDQEMITEDAGSAKKMEEVMILKKAAAKMGVKQMSSTAYLSESEEEAMIMAQEKSISFLKDVTDTDLDRRRKPPHLVRRASRDSRLLAEMMWYKLQNRLFMDKEESERAHENIILFLDSLMKAKEEARVLQQPSQGLKIQNKFLLFRFWC